MKYKALFERYYAARAQGNDYGADVAASLDLLEFLKDAEDKVREAEHEAKQSRVTLIELESILRDFIEEVEQVVKLEDK